jgi:hypothetical protein
MKSTPMTHRGGALKGSRTRARALFAALAAITVAALSFAGPASATQVTPYHFSGFFTGSDSTAGAFTEGLSKIEINQANGDVYVLDEGSSTISLFNSSGTAKVFPGLNGVSSLSVPSCFGAGDMAFDNFKGGGLYVMGCFEGHTMRAYNADGTIRIASFGFTGNRCGVGVDSNGYPWLGWCQGAIKYDPSNGIPKNEQLLFEQGVGHIGVDSNGVFYINHVGESCCDSEVGLFKYGTEEETRQREEETEGFGDHSFLRISYVKTQDFSIDLSDNNLFAIEQGNKVTQYTDAGQPVFTFGAGEGGFTGLTGAKGIEVNKTTHDVYVTSKDGGSPRVDIFQPQAPVTVPTATTTPAGHPDGTSAVLKGTIDPEGEATTGCKIEWGTTTQYLNGALACDQGNVFSSVQNVTHEVKSLTLGNVYHYRVVAKNANGIWGYGADRTFEASTPPTASPILIDRINTDGARFTATINPHGGTTTYHFEIGTEDCASNPCTHLPLTEPKLSSRLSTEAVEQTATGLQPDTTYYVRLVAENGAGEATPSRQFHTYPSPPSVDKCANAHVRQQTGAFLLPDCRAYELVSAANAGGYDVESTLVPGQTPFQAYPNAPDRVLYGLHFGSIPGIAGSPPNYGVDPYVAERDPVNGWVSRYVGVPADEMADPGAYGSPVLGADESLDTFAFGGSGICNPCFSGLGTNIPVRRDGAAAVPGMAGSLNPGESAPSGLVDKYLSADGSHLIFGSTAKFETAGAAGALTIYERNLDTGATEVASTDETGATFSGPGTAALDVSSGGSRVIVGEKVSTDSFGNDHYHLYMHLAGSQDSVDLTPGVGSGGALYGGMNSDGSRVFFTTAAKLLPADTDTSVDVYEAAVDQAGTATLRLVSVKSTGAPSNGDACSPPAEWNSTSGEGKCNALAFAGGAGVALGDGTFYFTSPEQLEGSEGTPDQVNLYVVKPGGNPQFVTTMDSSLEKPPPPPPEHPLANANFASATGAEAMTVDQSNGDVYVIGAGAGKVSRFDSTGAPKNFTEGPGAGTNTISAFEFDSPSASGVAVDNDPSSPLSGDFYVASYSGENAGVSIWSPTGLKLGKLTGSGTFNGSFGETCGVSVDQSDGSVYISSYSGYLWKYTPNSPSGELTDADYSVTGVQTTGLSPCVVAADSHGHVYASEYSDGPVKRFLTSSFAAGPPPGQSGSLVNNNSRGIAADPVTGDLYVDESSQIGIFEEGGERIGTISGEGGFSGSRGVAVSEFPGTAGHVYVSSIAAGKVADYSIFEPPFFPIDNPAILDAVRQAGTHSYSDFQVSRDGRYAAFSSGLSLTGFENLNRSEVYRYDSQSDELGCASCTTTLAPAKSDTFLSPDGLNLSSDGGVFFTSREGLVLSDTNEKLDAYEWSGGSKVSVISTGRSLDDSALLSVSENGKDVFFFTRDTLVPSDENGGAVKIYDAREAGGYEQFPTPKPCAASDECHGAGTPIPPPPNINSLEGAGGHGYAPPRESKTCAKGRVRRNGKCVKKHHPKHRRHRTRKHG